MISKEELDLVLLALAILSLDRPGWAPACRTVAGGLGAGDDARSRATQVARFDDFRRLNADRWVDGGAPGLLAALEASVKLQSFYAQLLNQHDGGDRRGFDDARAWMARVKETTNRG